MNKRINKLAIAAALSLLLFCCIFAAKSPNEGTTSAPGAPADTMPVLSAADADQSTTETDKVVTVTFIYKDSDGNLIAPLKTREVKVGWTDSSYAPGERADSGKTEESHETIDSLIENGVLTPYQIPGFPVSGPFWEKYGTIASPQLTLAD